MPAQFRPYDRREMRIILLLLLQSQTCQRQASLCRISRVSSQSLVSESRRFTSTSPGRRRPIQSRCRSVATNSARRSGSRAPAARRRSAAASRGRGTARRRTARRAAPSVGGSPTGTDRTSRCPPTSPRRRRRGSGRRGAAVVVDEARGRS